MTSVLRFLEDSGDEVELVQLAHWLQVSESHVVEPVDVLTKEGVFTNGLVASVEFGYTDDDDQPDDDPRPDTVRVFRGRPGAGSPTLGRGMDELGFFPYSLAETNDRLGRRVVTTGGRRASNRRSCALLGA